MPVSDIDAPYNVQAFFRYTRGLSNFDYIAQINLNESSSDSSRRLSSTTGNEDALANTFKSTRYYQMDIFYWNLLYILLIDFL
jgi:hypothetical protein